MMKRVTPLVLLLAPAALTGQALPQSDEAAIDEVFAAYDAPDVPGAAVAVIRGGEIIYSKAFGSAQLEYGIPVEPTTPFHVASVSKQFTAMAVLLLVEEGRIDLDEDVRTYLDWVPELPAVVTPRHLLTHTSGIRDQWELLMTAGWRLDDVITKEHVRRLMTKQRQLNFRPGTRQMYSNMGFSLAAELVQEVSGQPFDAFVTERILDPLGMERTHVHDDHRHVVPGRAYSYGSAAEGDEYANAVLSYANHGATSLFTTAEDLVVWLDNHRTGTVGGAMLDEMTTRTVLANGDTISNAMGLFIDDYRGRSRIQHGGGDAGFRSFVAWFPDDEVGIAVVSNLAATDAGGLANGVADVVLGSVLAPVEEDEAAGSDAGRFSVPEEPVEVDPATLERYVGAYATNMVNFAFEVRAGELWLTQPEEGPLVPVSEVAFVTDNGIARFEFEVDGDAVTTLYFQQGPTRLEGAPIEASEPVDPDDYVGAYWSPEIETLYEVRNGDDGLVLYTLRHGEMPLVHQDGDIFGGSQPFSRTVQFRRGPNGEVGGFTLSGGRVLNHRFLRVAQPMPGGGLPDA
jgi:CubicO group peptidase (beta-lactamase class C family)